MLCNQRKIDFNIIAEIAARRAPHRNILCKAAAVAVADEFARHARVYRQASCERPMENVCTHNDVMEMCVSAA